MIPIRLTWRAATGSDPFPMPPVLPRIAASQARNIPSGRRVPRTMAFLTCAARENRHKTAEPESRPKHV